VVVVMVVVRLMKKLRICRKVNFQSSREGGVSQTKSTTPIFKLETSTLTI